MNFPGVDDHYRCRAMTNKNIRCTKPKHSKSDLCSMHNRPKQQIVYSTIHPIDNPNRLNIGYPKFYVAEQIVDCANANKAPYLDIPWSLSGKSQSKLMVIMLDPDVTQINQYLHWLTINLDELNDDPQTNAVIEYESPVLKNHRYIYYLMAQPKILDKDQLKSQIDRNKFNLYDFIKCYDLKVLDCNYFWS